MSSTVAAGSAKQQARELIDELPDAVTWQDLAYRIEVRADIEAGLADIKAGRVATVSEVRREFGLSE